MSEDTQPAAAAAGQAAPAADAQQPLIPPVETPPAPAKKAAKKKAAPEEDTSSSKMVEATVRRGTVMVGDHGEEEAVGPGGKVTLPEKTVLALRKSGVLHDPEAPPSFASGPIADIDNVGPSVGEG